jgi:hypothetical protein
MLVHQGQLAEAAAVLAQHGAPAQAEHFPLYESVARGALAVACKDAASSEDAPAQLACHRFLLELLQALRRGQAVQDAGFEAMQDAWHAVHFSMLRAKCSHEGWHRMAAQQATALLRYAHLLPADAAYAAAGAIASHAAPGRPACCRGSHA